MTDIADQGRRAAREWAEYVADNPIRPGRHAWMNTVARVILATVDAPAPTLAEELRYWADLVDNGDPDGDTPQALRTLADRAAQVEHDLAEHEEAAEAWEQLTERIIAERDEAREEVERLTAVNEELRRTDNYREFRDKFLTVQKDAESNAESNAESPNPADVKPGEAWTVEAEGRFWTGLKDNDDEAPWTLARRDALLPCVRNCEIDRLVSRLVPAPRVIINPDELDRLGYRAVILSTDGHDVYQKDSNGEWLDVTSHGCPSRRVIRMENAVTVLWEPEA